MLVVRFSFPIHHHGLHAYWKAKAAQIIVIEMPITYRRSSFSLLVLVCVQTTVGEKYALIPICRYKASFSKTTNWYSFISTKSI